MARPVGEAKFEPLRVDYGRRLELKFHGGDISSVAGLLPYRELDDAFGQTELGGEVLSGTRLGENARHFLVELLLSNSTVKGSSCHLTPLAEVSQDHTGEPSTALPERLCRRPVYHRPNVVWLPVRWAMIPVGCTMGIYSAEFCSSFSSFFFFFSLLSICLAA